MAKMSRMASVYSATPMVPTREKILLSAVHGPLWMEEVESNPTHNQVVHCVHDAQQTLCAYAHAPPLDSANDHSGRFGPRHVITLGN